MDRATTSASNIHRRALCPGSARLEDGLPETDSEQSRKGTLLHLYDADPTLIPAGLSAEDRGLLKTSKRLTETILRETRKLFEIPPDEMPDRTRELEMVLHKGIKVLFPGHCDDFHYWRGRKLLVIIDEKFGFKEVTPAGANLQLRSYACMAAERWDCDNIIVAITQPRLAFDLRITMACYSRADIKASREQLYSIIAATKQPDAPLVAGEEQCRYCKAKMDCPAYRAWLEKLKGAKAHSCTNEELDGILLALAFAENIKEEAKDEARRRIEAGTFPQWKVGKDSQTPSVADTLQAIKLLSTAGIPNLTETDILERAKFSMGSLEELLHERGFTGKEAKDTIREALHSILTFTPRRGALKRVKEI